MKGIEGEVVKTWTWDLEVSGLNPGWEVTFPTLLGFVGVGVGWGWGSVCSLSDALEKSCVLLALPQGRSLSSQKMSKQVLQRLIQIW